MHNSLVTVGNGGNQAVRTELTILYNQGREQYQMEQKLAPEEQMLVDFGKLIREQIPDKSGHVLPPDVTSGAYRVRDLTDQALGNLYEGKVIVDKTNGHATSGCAVCCGYTGPAVVYDPLPVAVSGTSDQKITATNGCSGQRVDVTYDFFDWWTDNTAIATAQAYKITGVAAGSTNHHAQSVLMSWSGKTYGQCPQSKGGAGGGTNVAPTITSIDPPIAMIGSTGLSLTINGTGFGSSPTVNLPPGLSSTGNGYTDTKIVLTGVSIAFTATVGNNSITVTANSQKSNSATFQVNGPYHMIVEGDLTDKCTGCSTTVRRRVTYQVQNFDGTNAGATWIAEDIAFSGWSCNQQEGHQFAQCSQNDQTSSSGTFTDGWTMSSDAYTPTGCGFNVTYDHWQWCQHSPPQTLGTLTGYVHTDKVSINGVVSPSQIATGTVIPF